MSLNFGLGLVAEFDIILKGKWTDLLGTGGGKKA